MDFLQDLNEPQRLAVTNTEGPQLVIAGAGSGKTRVLTYRLAYILSQGLAYPQELLALTFTNKAAREMKDRIFRLVGPAAKSLAMGTFHSIFSRILRVEGERLGYTSSYTIYDSDDSKKQIKLLLKQYNLDDKIFKPGVVAHVISSAKNSLISPQELEAQAMDDFNRQVARIFGQYERHLFRSNAMDFDDLLLKPILLFDGHPDLLHKYQHRFKYILVDEYQDTNHAQYKLTKMLAAAHENICVVGDDAQSIYAFRGANILNILNFKKDYPDAKEYKLEQNYRSTKTIVEAANQVIARNKDQLQKTVFTENEKGEHIHILEAATDQDEARQVTGLIREQRQMHSFFNRDFAVLYRTNAQSRAMEDDLRRAGIPYKVFGGLSFYQRKEIKDVVAYLRLAINPRDEQALLRVINYPIRGIGKTTIQRLTVYAEDNGLNLWDALLSAAHADFNSRVIRLLSEFSMMIRSFGVAAKKGDAHHAASLIAKQSGILKLLHAEQIAEGNSRWENVQELLNAARAFVEDPDNENAGLDSFLADISLFTDQDTVEGNTDFVTLMTMHSAKGLEFKSVILVGMEENIFPSSLSLDTRAELEEERRLFYVAVTRAEKRLTLTYAKSRYRYGSLQFNEPSRFLDEIDERFVIRPRPVRRHSYGNFGSRKEIPRTSPAGGRYKPVKAASSASTDFDSANPKDIVKGIQVLHHKFGKGKVLQVEGDGAGKKATVEFREKGRKVLLLKYARLQILA